MQESQELQELSAEKEELCVTREERVQEECSGVGKSTVTPRSAVKKTTSGQESHSKESYSDWQDSHSKESDSDQSSKKPAARKVQKKAPAGKKAERSTSATSKPTKNTSTSTNVHFLSMESVESSEEEEEEELYKPLQKGQKQDIEKYGKFF